MVTYEGQEQREWCPVRTREHNMGQGGPVQHAGFTAVQIAHQVRELLAIVGSQCDLLVPSKVRALPSGEYSKADLFKEFLLLNGIAIDKSDRPLQ